jgi:hypothetical protein
MRFAPRRTKRPDHRLLHPPQQGRKRSTRRLPAPPKTLPFLSRSASQTGTGTTTPSTRAGSRRNGGEAGSRRSSCATSRADLVFWRWGNSASRSGIERSAESRFGQTQFGSWRSTHRAMRRRSSSPPSFPATARARIPRLRLSALSEPVAATSPAARSPVDWRVEARAVQHQRTTPEYDAPTSHERAMS